MEITWEKQCEAADKALPQLEIGPLKELRERVSPERLLAEGVTYEQMLQRALKTNAPAHDDAHELHLDALALDCSRLETVKDKARSYIDDVMKEEAKLKHIAVLRELAVMSQTVALGAVSVSKDRTELKTLQDEFETAIEKVMGAPVPGLRIGIKRFEHEVRDALLGRAI